MRGGLVESVHRGRYVVCDPTGEILFSAGDAGARLFPRSALKPLQALPLILSGAADAFELSDDELAVACASHYGGPRHVEAVRSLLTKAGLTESDLDNGAHPPTCGPAAEELIRRGEKPGRIHGNCSGKHAGMLAVCRHLGWKRAGYRRPEHPVQRWTRAIISGVSGASEQKIRVGLDGCGAPAFALPLRSLATSYARLATGSELPVDVGTALRRLRDAMQNRPYLVAGASNIDTTVMESSDLVAKRGADGVWCAGSGADGGWGLALKVSDGADRAVAPAAKALLESLGESPRLPLPPVTDLHGETAGEMVRLVPERREVGR
ncbi:asparaginase [Rubrobacter indicoceani]|uniref:asparaginase n=1 Tax=Rubrobacter indicoceani TaxID=2051957 RepID=UPI0023E22C65|nr:asparaginase [Rubrobacter indicoceani]